VFVTTGATAAFAGVLAFTITNIYRFETAGLNAFQLVIVGSAMEAAVFVAEVPTGVVADAFSRKWSVVVGHLGMGAGLLVEASWASFTGVLIAQVGWGIAYTFTSGANTAWVTHELGDPDRAALSKLFFRTSRWNSFAALCAVPLSYLLAPVSLRLPIAVGGAIEVGLGLWLIGAMRETDFRPEPHSGWRDLAVSTRQSIGVIRRSRVLVLLAVFTFIAGGASEAFDRFEQKQLIDNVGVPHWFGLGTLFWLGVLFSLSSLLGVILPPVVQRFRPAEQPARLRSWMVCLLLAQIAGLVVFGLTGAFVVAASSVLVVERSRSIRNTLFGAWIVPLTPKGRRATVLSAVEQCDSIGQVTMGPVFGAIGQLASVPTAIVTSAAVLVPGVGVVAMAARQPAPDHEAIAERS